MRGRHEADEGVGAALLVLYDQAMPEVYEYLARRCGNRAIADDLTAETFLAAMEACARRSVDQASVAWLIGIARHKLVDHWRRLAREDRFGDDAAIPERATWDVVLDPARFAPERLHQWLLTFPSAAAAQEYLDGRRAATSCAAGTVVLPGTGGAQVTEVTYERRWSDADGVAFRISGNPYGSGQAAAFGNLRGPVAAVQVLADGNHVWLLLRDEAVGGGGPPLVDDAALAVVGRAQLRKLG